VWSFAFFHLDDTKTMKEYLEMARPRLLMNGLGTHFCCSLIEIAEDNSVGGFTELLEYHPLINSRAHSLGKDGQ
jgi:hypothetical protein